MGGKGSGKRSQSFTVKRARELIERSENWLIKALDGEKNLKDKDIMVLALELVKKRVPMAIEEGTGGKITMVKIVKNHLPDKRETVDVVAGEVEVGTEKLVSKIKEMEANGDFGDKVVSGEELIDG